MTKTTLTALQELTQHRPTASAVAFRSGRSYAETKQDLSELAEAGLATEIPGTKADAFIPRYTITPEQATEAERLEFEAADRSIDAGEFSDAHRGEAEMAYLQRVLPRVR